MNITTSLRPLLRKLLVLLGVLGAPGNGRAESVTNVYRIVSGEYTECCGIAGSLTFKLPVEEQSYVLLAIDSAQLKAQMTILRDDRQTVFRAFEDGRVHEGVIEFGQSSPPPAPIEGTNYLHYIVSNSATGLRFDGVLIRPETGADIPNRFAHSNVVAVAVGPAIHTTIRISETEICWTSESNRLYQVDYASSLTTNHWVHLGPPIPGNGGTNCIRDSIPPGEPRRFYRVTNAP